VGSLDIWLATSRGIWVSDLGEIAIQRWRWIQFGWAGILRRRNRCGVALWRWIKLASEWRILP
jgi:hypothetical protein